MTTVKKYKKERIINILQDLSLIYSPTGYTENVLRKIENIAEKANISFYRTNKKALIVGNHSAPQLMVSGHVDTLGLMVSNIQDNGVLNFTCLGGPVLSSFEGEYLKILTRSGKTFSGTLVLNNPSIHVNNKAAKTERTPQTMHIRTDIEAEKAQDLRKLGIEIGDFVAFESRFEFTETGFIKSRFLDDKAGCAAMIEAFLTLGDKNLKKLPVAFYFSNYEEVGHGAVSAIPDSVKEFLAVDMGVVGDNVAGSEFCVSICAKDSSGPYDFDMVNKLVTIAKSKKIPYKVDIFPYYGSDASALNRAGHDIRTALIGPGVAASHGCERTHIKGLKVAAKLTVEYIKTYLK